eukprot:TRINITY_DN1226_c0_g2_i1.p1 TRINITY_DN1226_c0_g2~~TRINITY_DN1226_c0_g2_i1.p1  ORF type:complete len:1093 (-),score=224.89 TRINITY_DN1226_c0_g2_i1:1290-4568(-)
MSNPRVADLVQKLCDATSGDARVRVPAHRVLQESESQPGFTALLLEAYADPAANPQGRYLAILTCKSVVERNWQPRSGQSLGAEEKALVRDLVLKLVKMAVAGELPHLVELCMVLRKICRFDFPKSWEGLAHFLLQALQRVQQSGFDDATLGLMIVLHHVLKEQASKRLLGARKSLHEVGQGLISPLGFVWSSLLEKMRSGALGSDERTWKLSRYLDGCFFIVLTQGFAHLHDDAKGPQLVALAREKVAFLLGQLSAQPHLLVQSTFYQKNLKSVLKWWANLLGAHPLAFSQANVREVLGLSTELLSQGPAVAASNPALRPLVEALLRSSLQMLTHACNAQAYRAGPQPAHQGAAREAAAACHLQFKEFLDRHNVAALCGLVCKAALRQTAEDVAAWLADPEDQLHGPSSQLELSVAGEACVKALGQSPLDRPLVEHVAKRMEEEATTPPTMGEHFEAVAWRDTLLVLLSLCHPLLKPHLQFQQLLSFSAPIVALVPRLNDKTPEVLLPVRLCGVLKAWAGEIPQALVPAVVQLLQGFLQEGSPKALRLASIGPLRALLDRFSDHEAWTQVQSTLIDACLALLVTLSTPDCQWRCLNLVHLFLCEEAESGRYEATERSLGQLLRLWSSPEAGELLICHALLDVLRALVLMSCRSRSPRLPLSPPLLSSCMVVISDCFALHTGNAGSPVANQETCAALEADIGAAAGHLGDRGSAASTLFDSGNLLFLGVLRTVDLDQMGPLLGFFPRLVVQCSQQSAEALQDSALDMILEYVALHVAVESGRRELQQHYEALVRLCRKCLESNGKTDDRSKDVCLQMLQLLMAHAMQPAALELTKGVVEPLLRLWATTFTPQAASQALRYALHTLLPVFAAWQMQHKQHFKQQALAGGDSQQGFRLASLLLVGVRRLRPVEARASILACALSLLEDCGCNDDAFWCDFLQCCDELVRAARKPAGSADLAQAMRNLKSSVSTATKLPVAARSSGELRCALLPPQLREALRADGSMDEAAVARWFFEHVAQTFRQMSATRGLNVPALLSAAPPLVQEALRATGSSEVVRSSIPARTDSVQDIQADLECRNLFARQEHLPPRLEA